jgi:predicted alpha/beta superfamily hydrolase
MTWYENASDEYKDYYDVIYMTDGEKVYKQVKGGVVEECTVKEILERNIEGTTIQKCRVDIFYTAGL